MLWETTVVTRADANRLPGADGKAAAAGVPRAARASRDCAAIDGPCDRMFAAGTGAIKVTDSVGSPDATGGECVESAKSDRGGLVACMVSQCVAKSQGKRNDMPQSSHATPLCESTPTIDTHTRTQTQTRTQTRRKRENRSRRSDLEHKTRGCVNCVQCGSHLSTFSM